MNVHFSVDPTQNVRPISRYIYGINQPVAGYSNFTYQRLGGNLATTWNWVTGNSNAGHDYYYQNESWSYFTGGTSGPGGTVSPTLQIDAARNAATLLTVPITGYVAANEANDDVLNTPVTTVTGTVGASATIIPVANAAAIPSTPYYIVVNGEEMQVTGVNLANNTLTVVRGISGGNASAHANDPVYLSPDVRNAGSNFLQTQFKQELPTKPGGPGSFTLTPDPNAPVVYADEFVNWVKTMFPNGQTNPNTPIWYSLDNEPDLWNSTHTEVQPTALTYAQLVQASIAYAKAIRSVDPNAQVFGPASYGWEGFVSLQDAPDAQGRNWLDYYLQQMQQASAAAGQRLLNVLDVHWYTSTADDPAARVQAPRSLWDPTYMEDSWIAQNIPGPINLLPRLQADIDHFYSGTKLSISEYNYGGGDDISGAIAQADALGIFGVHGLYAASEWKMADDESYIGGAFNMFRDFDGKNGTFGDTSVMASTNDAASSSVYASVDSANKNLMTLLAINKSTQAQTATVQLSHVQPGATAAIYQLTGASATPTYVGTVTISDPVHFTYSMPGSSVTTIRIVSPSGQGKVPTVSTAAQASPSTVTGVSTTLGALGADTSGESNLTYTWTATTAPAPVTFSVNGTNAAKQTLATFRAAGKYTFLVTITNAQGYFATSTASATVNPTVSHISLSPLVPTVVLGGQQQFTAKATDQFGHAMTSAPSFSWSASSGAVTSTGRFTAPAAAGSFTITAAAGGVSASTAISVVSTTTITVDSATDAALRAAIATANVDAASGVAATIIFAPGLAGSTIKLSSAPLELKAGPGAIRIEGGGLISLSGDGKSTVFQIDAGAHVTLDGLTIRDGSAGTGSGGGIRNAGDLNVSNSTLASNAAGDSGGGIDNSGSLTVANVTFNGNSAGTDGGGIANEPGATLSVSNSLFSGNSAPTGGGLNNDGTAMVLDASFSGNIAGASSGSGGGIGNSGTLTLIDAMLSDNTASVAGGGIYNVGSMTVTGSTIDDNSASYIAGGINNVGTMSVTNSTLAGNYSYLGGGIYNGNFYGLSGHLTLSNDTITSNFADYGAGGGIYMANGTYSSTGGSTLTMFNTIVAGNYASGNDNDPLSNPTLPFGPDIQVYSGTVSGSHNLIGIGQGLTGISNGDSNHNQVGTPTAPIDPMLALPVHNADFPRTLTSRIAAFNQSLITLADNGGPTKTIALRDGSAAQGAGGAITTLVGPLANGSSSIRVADAAAIASTPGRYFIFVDGEEMEVTDVNLTTNVLTVVRAINGVAATLQAGDPVYLENDQRGFTRANPNDLGAFQTSAKTTAAPSITSVSPAQAPTAGGTQVTIAGVNLAGTTAVYFGTHAATIISVSATLIRVTCPAGAEGTVDVTVVTPDGTSATSPADKFTYEAVPTITSIGPATGLPGGGTGVVITGTNLLGASVVTFGGHAATIYSASLTQFVVIDPAGAVGTVDVRVTTPSGTSAITSADRFTYVAVTSSIVVTTASDDLVHTGISLRDAIAQANLDAGQGRSDTIRFSSSLYGQTITLAQGAAGSLVLSGHGGLITIDGGGKITVSGAAASRIFQVAAGTQAVLAGLTMIDGKAGDGDGGAVNNAGTLMMVNDRMSNNTATNGGAIDNAGILTLMNATISSNTATTGGGIDNHSGGRMTVTGSTLSANTGSYVGGAINNLAVMTVVNSTLAGNSSYLGGAINNGNQYGTGGTLMLTNDTISGNTVSGNGGGIYMENGGYDPKPSSLTLRNTIVAGNRADQPGPDLYVSSGALAGSYNLIGIGTNLTGISNNTKGNQVGTVSSPIDPRLGPLANNGGPTQTMALQWNSPAIAGAGAVTTLTAAVSTATATTITVGGSALIAVTNTWAGKGYVIVIDGEAMLVTARSGSTLTVQRGYHGTTASTHANGAPVFLGADQRGLIVPTTVPDLGAFQSTLHLVVTRNPLSQTVDVGQKVTLSAVARGAITSVQWQVSADNGQTWSDIPGANAKSVATVNGLLTTTATLSLNAALAMNGQLYRVAFINSTGSRYSNAAKLHVNPALAIADISKSQWTVSLSGFSGTLTISGGTQAFTIKLSASLPTGLVPSISGNVIKFTGTPTTAGVFKGTITIQDAAGATLTKAVAITINPAVGFSLATLPAYTINVPYSQTISAIGGTGPVTLAYTLDKALPAGLTITPASPTTKAITISGTPLAKLTVKITVTATDSVGAKKTVVYTLTS